MVDLSGISVVTKPTKKRLNERQLEDYRHHREQCLTWLLAVGKDPQRADGYAFSTVKSRANRMDQFYRWVWEQEDGYTAHVTTEHADAYMQALAYDDDYSDAHKDTCQKAVQMLFKWIHHDRGGELWKPAFRFNPADGSSHPRDYLTMEERGLIREASFEYGSVPAYGDLSPDARD